MLIDKVNTLWSKIEKNTDKIAIQSFTVPWARERAKWASERTSGASKRASGPVLQSVFLAVIDHSGIVALFYEKARKQQGLSLPLNGPYNIPYLPNFPFGLPSGACHVWHVGLRLAKKNPRRKRGFKEHPPVQRVDQNFVSSMSHCLWNKDISWMWSMRVLRRPITHR